jgi:DNA-binding LacI/PurR family transcriptional regulator
MTAVFCHSDLIAIGAIGAAHASGLDVPGDISIVGFDGIKVGAYASPPLTTVAQQKERLAELSVQTVLSLIAGEQPVRCGLLPGELITRGSSAPPRDNGR